MPAYSKTTWVNGSTPAINATNLNKIEQGIADAVRKDGSEAMTAQLITIAGSAATPAIAPTGDANTGIYFPAADTIAFGEGGTEVMRINNNGTVCVNGSLNSGKFNVQGDSGLTSFTGTTFGTHVLRAAGAFGDHVALDFMVGLPAARIAMEYTSTGSILKFGTTNNFANGINNTALIINPSGNVGIGTTSPSVSLHVKNTGIIQRLETTTARGGGQNYLQFNDPTGQKGYVGYSSTDDKMYLVNGLNESLILGANNSVHMTINSAGNVGIGVSPNAELHVKGTGEILRLETTTARGSGSGYLGFSDPTGVKGYVGYISPSSDNFFITNELNANMTLRTNATERIVIEAGGTTRPAANNTYDLGSATYRWATIYAQNALNTSDARLKTDVAPSSLGLDFISALNPVQYRWIEGGNTVEKVQTGTETVEISPAIPAQPELLDEEGNIIQEATEEIPAVTEERPVYETVVTPREGVRTHFGLIAQEVKAALPDGLDFAGWCLADKDDADSTQSLGYTQLIAPMIKAIQELNAKVEALEAQLNGN